MINEQVKDIKQDIKEWFSSHSAQFLDLSHQDASVKILKWKKPNSSLYSITYIIYNNVLFVSGDMSFAVYRWSTDLNWDFLASCDPTYFASKCEASDAGVGNKQWYEEKCVKQLELLLDNLGQAYYDKNVSDDHETWVMIAKEEKEKHINYALQEKILRNENRQSSEKEIELLKNNLYESCISAYSWGLCMQNYYWLFESYEDSWGIGVSVCCHAHLIGIQMATKQKMQQNIENLMIAESKISHPSIPRPVLLQIYDWIVGKLYNSQNRKKSHE